MSAGLQRLWLLLVATSALLTAAAQETRTPPLVPALFVFGDSLVDNGNNNNLASLAKANYFPYGIDFVAGPTGRFCNGYTIVDELGTYARGTSQSPQIQRQKNKMLSSNSFMN
jgi:phospholipase/lecithinase/hemolysin